MPRAWTLTRPPHVDRDLHGITRISETVLPALIAPKITTLAGFAARSGWRSPSGEDQSLRFAAYRSRVPAVDAARGRHLVRDLGLGSSMVCGFGRLKASVFRWAGGTTVTSTEST